MRTCRECSAELQCYSVSCICAECGTLDVLGSPPTTEPEKQKMPSVFKQAKNFARSAARHIADGGQSVPENLKNARLEICSGCDKLSGDKCSECGCLVSIKAAWASEECPIGKWERYEQTRGKCGGCGGK
jgi:hypothetical protein